MAIVGLLYGALMMSAAIKLNDEFGIIRFMDKLDLAGLFALIVIAGTIGVYVLRSFCLQRDEWSAARSVCIALCGVLGVISSVVGNRYLAAMGLVTALTHLALWRKAEDD